MPIIVRFLLDSYTWSDTKMDIILVSLVLDFVTVHRVDGLLATAYQSVRIDEPHLHYIVVEEIGCLKVTQLLNLP